MPLEIEAGLARESSCWALKATTSMNIDRKALWAVRESGLPTVVKPCVDCSGARHRPSGRSASTRTASSSMSGCCCAAQRAAGPRRCPSTNASTCNRWSGHAGWRTRTTTRP